MKPSILFLMLYLLPLAAAACNGGQSDEARRASLTRYLSAVNAVRTVTDAKIGPVQQQLDSALDDDDLLTADEREALRAYFSERAAVVEETIGSMNRIEPPDEFAAAHRAYIDAASAVRDVLQDAATMEFASADADQVLADLAPVGQRVAAACAALQDVADANEIGVSLGCGS